MFQSDKDGRIGADRISESLIVTNQVSKSALRPSLMPNLTSIKTKTKIARCAVPPNMARILEKCASLLVNPSMLNLSHAVTAIIRIAMLKNAGSSEVHKLEYSR